MCRVSIQQEVLTEKMVVYKVVRVSSKGRILSQFAPYQRDGWWSTSQHPLYDLGEDLQYDIGTEVESPGGPGIYVYTKLEYAEDDYGGWRYGRAILEMEVPAGTKVRWAERCAEYYLAVEKVKVLRRIGA